MITIKIEIDFGYKKRNLTAMLKDDLSALVKDKKNDATAIDDDYGTEKRWSITFGNPDKDGICVTFLKDDDFKKTLDIEYAYIHQQGSTENIIYQVGFKHIRYDVNWNKSQSEIRDSLDTEKFIMSFDKYELNTIFRGLNMVHEKCERIDKMLAEDFTEEFHTGLAGHLNEKGGQLFRENMSIKLSAGGLIFRLKELTNEN